MPIKLVRKKTGPCKKPTMVVDEGHCPRASCFATEAPHPPIEAYAKSTRKKGPHKAKDVAVPNKQCSGVDHGDIGYLLPIPNSSGHGVPPMLVQKRAPRKKNEKYHMTPNVLRSRFVKILLHFHQITRMSARCIWSPYTRKRQRTRMSEFGECT